MLATSLAGRARRRRGAADDLDDPRHRFRPYAAAARAPSSPRSTSTPRVSPHHRRTRRLLRPHRPAPGTYDISVGARGGASDQATRDRRRSARPPRSTSIPRPRRPRGRSRRRRRRAGDDRRHRPRAWSRPRPPKSRPTSAASRSRICRRTTATSSTSPQLAPGIKVNQTEFRQTFAGGGVGADRDGESLGGRRSTCSSTASA